MRAHSLRRPSRPAALALAALLAWPAAALSAPAAESPRVWITIDQQALDVLRESRDSDDWAEWLVPSYERDGLVALELREDQLPLLSQALHTRLRRCGGFMAHDTREEALAALEPAPEAQSLISYTIDNGPVVQALMAEVKAANIADTITQLAAFNNRYYTSTTGVQAANWLRTRWQGYATGRSDVSVDLFSHPNWAQPSVIATVTGTTLPSEVVVVGGHLDSINQSSPATGRAPGADDDASGVATLGEVFRAAMARGYRPQRTVKFIGYAAEEVGLRGSAAIASRYQTDGVNVVGVLQLDMTDYKGSTVDMGFITDFTNAAQNTFLGNLFTTYLPGYACSDHASWHNRGYVASFPFEALFNGSNPRIHTANDTLANADPTCAHALKFSKLTAAYVAELAKGNLGGGGDTTPPTTSITSPAAGATVSGTTTVAANAADNVGVTRVELYVDGTLAGTDTSSPYSFAWNTTTVANGSHSLSTRAFDAAGNFGDSASVPVTVSNTGGGADLTATYDATLRAPRCGAGGRSCDSGPSLLLGRGTRGPEPNAPNTINSSCADGNSGTFHSDESNDRIKVSTTDGTPFAAGKTVRIDATVWAWTTPSADKLDLYYAANANSPSWVFITTLTPPGSGARTLSANYTLPSGSLQAVRARFRYQGSAAACGTGSYNDHDDLVFAVE
jgi:leucyl aminopeptidase